MNKAPRWVNMFNKMIAMFMISFLVVAGGVVSEDDIDPVIDMLLNGVSREITNSVEDIKNETSLVAGGIWKCGNCTDLGETRLVHSEINEADAGMDQDADVQISLIVEGMQCVMVSSDQPGAVKKVLGTCDGSSVTLSVSSSQNFTLLVYA